ncbi:MAG TPA: DUF5916 domain-containing protein, partial [Flavisolibacter sp.]|nr:DUF5916 domain-containing protein [Flavisolibacter sp.]
SDSRKKLYASIEGYGFWGSNKEMGDRSIGSTITFQPIDALRISLSANYSYYFRKQDQFVSNVNYNNAVRSIVGEVKQKTVRFTSRVSYNITPDLTLQYYGQPFITRPLYGNYAYVSNPLAKKYNNRFTVYHPNQIKSDNGTFLVDENIDGVTDYRFAKPDFNFVQFRSNLVLRWEYKPGSEFYLVWSQSNTADAFNELDTPIVSSLLDNAFADQSRNIFLVKCTYRFLR